MKRFTLLSLALIGFCGCADQATNDSTTSNTVQPGIDEGERYEVSKPVVEHPVTDENANPGAPSDPQAPLVNPPAPTEGPALSTDADSDLSSENTLDSDEKSPLDQNENQTDIDLTANIRNQIVDADDMSVSARNVQIVTQNGRVTLSGEVSSQEEMDRIEEIATRAAGAENVDNKLQIKDSE
jgi:hypothetical protein